MLNPPKPNHNIIKMEGRNLKTIDNQDRKFWGMGNW